MTMSATWAIGSMLAFGFANIGMAQTATGGDQGVTVTVKGESWDADSRGFAAIGALSKTEGEKTSARRGSRISVDGRPDKFAIAGPGSGFELKYEACCHPCPLFFTCPPSPFGSFSGGGLEERSPSPGERGVEDISRSVDRR